MNEGQDTTVVNLYETEEYKYRASLFKNWYDAGYVKLDAATATDGVQAMMKNGTLFSYISNMKPGFKESYEGEIGRALTLLNLPSEIGKDVHWMASSAYNYSNWGITRQSADPAKAMKFLNFTYTNSEWNNLMNFALEGEDYVFVEGSDNVVTFPEGKSVANSYHLNMGWMLPNQFIGYVWEGQPEDIFSQWLECNNTARKSKAFGFMADLSSVSTELTALKSVQDEYVKTLAVGAASDLDATLQEFNDKLYANGLEAVMDVNQEQLDAFLAGK